MLRLGWPVKIPLNYTLPGDVMTYNYTLEGGHTYHAYLMGEFVNLTGRFSEARAGYEVLIDARCSGNQTTLLALTDNDVLYMRARCKRWWTLTASTLMEQGAASRSCW